MWWRAAHRTGANALAVGFVTASGLPDWNGGIAGGTSHVALVASAAVPDRAAVSSLAADMAAAGAAVGLGTLRLPDGRLHRPPSRLDDLRFRDPACTAVTLVERSHMAAVLADLRPDARDPVLHWRVVRAAVAAGCVLTTDAVVGRLPEHVLPGPIPIDLAGPRFEPGPRADLILLYGEVEASISLYFDGLPTEVQQRLRFLTPSSPMLDLPHLLAASLVVLVRGFEGPTRAGTLDVLDAMGVPYAWFVDDNVLALRQDQDGFEYYSADRVAAFVARTRGVLASTPTLAAALAPFGRPVLHWPCLFDPSLAGSAASDGEPPALGIVGGSFRRDSLLKHVLPALHRADPTGRMTLHARFDLIRGVEDARIRPAPMEPSFRQFVHAWRNHGVGVLLHPAGDAANMPFKSPATLLAARYLGAVAVVARETAYAGLGRAEGVCIAEPDVASWEKEIRDLTHPAARFELFSRLDGWCRATFAPDGAADRLAVLDSWTVPSTPGERDRRLRRALSLTDFPDHAAASLHETRHPVPLTSPEPMTPDPVSLRQRVKWRLLRGARWVAGRTGTLHHARSVRDRFRSRSLS